MDGGYRSRSQSEIPVHTTTGSSQTAADRNSRQHGHRLEMSQPDVRTGKNVGPAALMSSEGANNTIQIQLVRHGLNGFGFELASSSEQGTVTREQRTVTAEKGTVSTAHNYPCVAKLTPGGVAEQSGLLEVGDVIVRVNDVTLSGVGLHRATRILESVRPGCQVTLTVRSLSCYRTYLETVCEEGRIKPVRINLPGCWTKMKQNGDCDHVSPPPACEEEADAKVVVGGDNLGDESKDETEKRSGNNKVAYTGKFPRSWNPFKALDVGTQGTKLTTNGNVAHDHINTVDPANDQAQSSNREHGAFRNIRDTFSFGLCTDDPAAENKTEASENKVVLWFRKTVAKFTEPDDARPETERNGQIRSPGEERRCETVGTSARDKSTPSSGLQNNETQTDCDVIAAGDRNQNEGVCDVINGVARQASRCPVTGPQVLRNYMDNTDYTDTLHTAAVEGHGCSEMKCVGALIAPSTGQQTTFRTQAELTSQAVDFINQYYASIKRSDTPAHKKRLSEVEEYISRTGTYEQTIAELTFGAKTAWRNAPRCIGRIQWSKLQVFDARHIRNARGMYEALCNHIKYGTNKGNIRSAITVFPPRSDGEHDFRVWNGLLIRYAGYQQPDGSVVGDRSNVEFTQMCERRFGWKGTGGMFDVLPLVLQANGEDPELFNIPEELVLEVKFTHAQYPGLDEMGLRWYALPAVSNMMLDCGGLQYCGAPFNGWYMGTEIGARDLCDVTRYNLTEQIAHKMGLDTRTNFSLWKDQVVVELNKAILCSFMRDRVTLVDHHTAAESFMQHLENEKTLRGGCPADWVWIVPPISGSITPVFHQEMILYKLKPSYEYMDDPWKTHDWKRNVTDTPSSGTSKRKKKLRFKDVVRVVQFSSKLMRSYLAKRIKCTVLYATETGRSEKFAKTLCAMLKTAFDARVLPMDDYDVINLEHESLVLVVTSTFGNGDPPENAITFAKDLNGLLSHETDNSEERSLVKQLSIDQERSFQAADSQPQGPSDAMDNFGHSEKLSNVRSGSKDPRLDATPLQRHRTWFSVFALGSTAYPNFCAFGRYVDRLLGELGAERIQPMGEGDEMCGQEDSFRQWAKDVFKAACETFCLEDQVGAGTAQLSQSDEGWTPGRYRLTPVDAPLPHQDICRELAELHRRDVYVTKLTARTQLQSPSSDRQTILVQMETENQTQLDYLPGDHVAVYPANRKEIVDAILDRISCGTSPDVRVRLEVQKEKTSAVGPVPCWRPDDRMSEAAIDMRTTLTRFLDVTNPPSSAFLGTLAQLATDERDITGLEALAEDSEVYGEWRHDLQPTLADVLRLFPSVRVPATLLLSQLPVLQPRYYSISSSKEMNPGEIHLTVAVVRYQTQDELGPSHFGVCSNWLNDIPVGETIPCFVRSSAAFHLPKDTSLPVIMVGPGTGIAPFRAFWQERLALKGQGSLGSKAGSLTLYFGCRQSNQDDIYRAEKKIMVAAGVLTECHTALSRDPHQPKTYVQQLLLRHSKAVSNKIIRQGGHFYVCGDVAMAADVGKTLELILKKDGGLTGDEAKAYVLKMREQSRFHEDIFGVTLKTSDVRKKARQMATHRGTE